MFCKAMLSGVVWFQSTLYSFSLFSVIYPRRDLEKIRELEVYIIFKNLPGKINFFKLFFRGLFCPHYLTIIVLHFMKFYIKGQNIPFRREMIPSSLWNKSSKCKKQDAFSFSSWLHPIHSFHTKTLVPRTWCSLNHQQRCWSNRNIIGNEVHITDTRL